MNKVYIVAEVSQNHNGDMDIAKQLIEDARMAGCDAVKFNKRDLSHELTDEAYKRIYDSPNAFKRTYGKHREFLELSEDQHRFLKRFANNRGLDYLLSVCDIPSLEFALSLDPPLIKIPSKEIINIPLLEEIAKYDKKVAFSIGLATDKEVERARDILPNATIVICTSEYPTDLDNVNLNRIFVYNMENKVGFSSHVPDPMLGVAAVAMGATFIEFHITIDREMKGSDQIVALELEEMSYMVSAIRDLEIALGEYIIPNEIPDYLKANRKKFMKTECEDGVYRIH